MTDALPPDVLTVVPYTADELDGQACANLVSTVLMEAMLEAAYGIDGALLWLWTPYARHLAALLDIDEWPPGALALARVRKAHGRK